MQKAIGELSTAELERLIEHTIDRRLEVWLTQLADALLSLEDGEEVAELRPEFAASLRRSLEQARSGDVLDLKTFREQIGR
jgi:hypothetical protein